MPPGCGCMPPGYGCMPPDNAPEIEVLQSCYQSSLVLALNDRESTIHLGVKELGSNGLTFPQEMSWSVRSASTNFFYLAAAKGGLHLPALTSLFQNPQIARQYPLLTSSNSSTRNLAEGLLVVEDKSERRKFKLGKVVRKALADNPGRIQRVLHTAA